VCDFADVQLTEVSENRVKVEGAKGYAPPENYKACTLEVDGYRLTFLLMVTGRDAAKKAQRVAESLIKRMQRVFPMLGWGDFRKTSIEILGAESQFGPHSQAQDSREVVMKLSAHHDKKEALAFFSREIPSSALSMAQSLIGGGSGLPRPMPLIRMHSMLVPRKFVTITVDDLRFTNGDLRLESARIIVNPNAASGTMSEIVNEAIEDNGQETVEVSLLDIAYGRSGDKGDICNIGIVARRPELVPVLRQALAADVVKNYLAHLVDGEVERYELPGLNAFNFVCYEALDGGGTSSLRFDPLGKGMAQILLECKVKVPASLMQNFL
jgi:hypothetical protein